MTTLSRTLRTAAIGDGNHEISVIATDAGEQTTTSLVRRLRIDRTAPRATIVETAAAQRPRDRQRRRQVRDLGRRQRRDRLGRRQARQGRRATHRYRRAGRYAITVTTRDTVGNRRTVVKKVVLR